MDNEKFCLRWNDFERNISSAFKELRNDKDFFDVTLACDDDQQIQAHKVIIAACSPFFRNILRRNHHQHPLLYIKGVKYMDLQAVLNFMYHGEVNVAQEELNSFLAVAEDLRVKGLTQTQQPQATGTDTSTPKQSTTYTPPEKKSYTNTNPPKPTHRPVERSIPCSPAHVSSVSRNNSKDIEEVVPIKSEPRDPQSYVITQPLAVPDSALANYQEDAGYEDYDEYQEDMFTDGTVHHNSNSSYSSDSGKACIDYSHVNAPDDLYYYCVREDGDAKWKCSICDQFKHVGRNNVRNHVESKHFPTQFTYYCEYCEKTCHTKRALEVHNSEKHRYAKVAQL